MVARTRLAALVLLTLTCTACESLAPSTDDPQTQLDRFVARNSWPRNSAVAVATDGRRWIWTGSRDEPTENNATDAAMVDCRRQAVFAGIDAPCRIHAINGVVQAPSSAAAQNPPQRKPAAPGTAPAEAPSVVQPVITKP